MKRSTAVLWIRALRGSKKAYRKLAMLCAWGHREERILARLCLEKAIEMGDEYSFFLYHRYFPGAGQAIDDFSYKAICDEYVHTLDAVERKKLRRYLKLGTSRQRWLYFRRSDAKETINRKRRDRLLSSSAIPKFLGTIRK